MAPRRPRALLTGFTAAESYGLQGWERSETDLLVPPGARILTSSPVAVRAHRVRDWSLVRRDRTAPIHLCAQALLVVSAGGITAALECATRVRHRRHLVAAIADIAPREIVLGDAIVLRFQRRRPDPAGGGGCATAPCAAPLTCSWAARATQL